MRFILIPLLSLLPCLLWLWYFYTRSIYKRDPLPLILWTFALGGVATLIALPLNLIGQSLVMAVAGQSQFAHLLVIFLVVAPVEELCKLLAVYVYAWRHQEFDEPLDGVIYSAAAALGFAAVENLIYLSRNDASLVLLRGPLSNPGHALFSALWGLSLSRVRSAPNIWQQRLRLLAVGWLLATVLHAVFDALLVASENVGPILFPLPLAAIIGLFLWVRSRLHFHRDTSPHREGTMLLTVGAECPQCRKPGLAGTTCTKCGALIPERVSSVETDADASPNSDESQPAFDSRNFRPRLLTRSLEGTENVAWLLKETEVSVGRTLNNNFVIDHPSVSRRHARIVAGDSTYTVCDLGSSNGTFVNGRRITEAKLTDGCEVRFGSVSFLYRAQNLSITWQQRIFRTCLR